MADRFVGENGETTVESPSGTARASSDYLARLQPPDHASGNTRTPSDRLRAAAARFGRIRPILRSRQSKLALTAASATDQVSNASVIAAQLRARQGGSEDGNSAGEPLVIAAGWATDSLRTRTPVATPARADDFGTGTRPPLRITNPTTNAEAMANRFGRSSSAAGSELNGSHPQTGKTPPPAPPRRNRSSTSLSDAATPRERDESKITRPGTPAPLPHSARLADAASGDSSISLRSNPLHAGKDRPAVVSSRHLGTTPLPPPPPHGRARHPSHSSPSMQTGVVARVNPLEGAGLGRGGGQGSAVQSRPAPDAAAAALAPRSAPAVRPPAGRLSHASAADSSAAGATPVSTDRSEGATSGKRTQRASVFGWFTRFNPASSPLRQRRPGAAIQGDSKTVPAGGGVAASEGASEAGASSRFAKTSSQASEAGLSESGRQRARSEAERYRRQGQAVVLLTGAKAGIPLREGLQSLFRIGRSKLLMEGCMFLLQFLVLVLVVQQAFDARLAFKQELAMRNAVLGDGLTSIGSLGDVWDWLESTALPGLWPTELYPGDPLLPDQLGMVSQYNQLVGPVELRLARVGPDSCTNRRFLQFGRRFDTPDGSCYADFIAGAGAQSSTGSVAVDPFAPPTEATNPFGVRAGNNTGLGFAPYTWSLHEDAMTGWAAFGVGSYGYGGYSILIPNSNTSLAAEVLSRLRAGRFIDKSMRALGLHATFYNTNTRLLQSLRVTVEQFPSGLVSASHIGGTARLLLYEDRSGMVRGAGEVIMALLILWAIAREARRFYHTHPHRDYCTDVWNLYEMFVHLVSIALIAAWLSFVTNSRRVIFDASNDTPVSYRDVVRQYSVASDLAGLLFALSAAKAFKFLQALDKRMAVLWLTLQRSSVDAALFMIGFVCIMIGFSFAGVHVFGPYVQQFQDVSSAMATLVQLTAGEVDYPELVEARPGIAPWYVSIYIFLCSLLFANLLIAIVNRSFETISEEIQFDETWKEGLPDLRLEVFMTCRRSCRGVKNACPCCYRVFCFARANTAKKLRTQQQLRTAAISLGHADRGRGPVIDLALLTNNPRAVRAGVRISEGETLDAWMVRKLLQGNNNMRRVRRRAQAILDADERLRYKPVLQRSRPHPGSIAQGRERASRWQLGSSRSVAEGERSPARCCGGWCCGGGGEGLMESKRDLFELPATSSMSMLGIRSTSASATPQPGTEAGEDDRGREAGLKRELSSSSLRGGGMQGRKRRTLPTDRTLFHAVRAEAERLTAEEDDTAADDGDEAEERRRQGRQAVRASGSMQMRVWEAQERFLGKMRQAARLARRRPQKSVDLYAYFNAAWMESGGRTIYMSMQELCLLTPGRDGCQHVDCAAKQVMDAYQAWKAVILLKGASKKQFSGSKEDLQDSFFVIKVNKAGRKQERLVVVDRLKAQLKGFDMQHNLRRMLPLSQLVQIEQSRVDATRLNLVFSDGVGANWALLFITSWERDRFAQLVYDVVSKRRASGHSRQRARRATIAPEDMPNDVDGGHREAGGRGRRGGHRGAVPPAGANGVGPANAELYGPRAGRSGRGSGRTSTLPLWAQQQQMLHQQQKGARHGMRDPIVEGEDYGNGVADSEAAVSRRQLYMGPSGRSMASYGASELFPGQPRSDTASTAGAMAPGGVADTATGHMSASGLIATAALLQGSASTGLPTPTQRRSFQVLQQPPQLHSRSPPSRGGVAAPGETASPPDTDPGMASAPGGGEGRAHRRTQSGDVSVGSREPFARGGRGSSSVRIEGVPEDLDLPSPPPQTTGRPLARGAADRARPRGAGVAARASAPVPGSARWSRVMTTGLYDAGVAGAATREGAGGEAAGAAGGRRVSFAGGAGPRGRGPAADAVPDTKEAAGMGDADGDAAEATERAAAAASLESPIPGVGLGGGLGAGRARGGSAAGRRRSAVGPERQSLARPGRDPGGLGGGQPAPPPGPSWGPSGAGFAGSRRRSSALGLRRPAAGPVVELSTIQEGSSFHGSPARGSTSQSGRGNSSSGRTSNITETSREEDDLVQTAVGGAPALQAARLAVPSFGDSSSASTRRLAMPHATAPAAWSPPPDAADLESLELQEETSDDGSWSTDSGGGADGRGSPPRLRDPRGGGVAGARPGELGGLGFGGRGAHPRGAAMEAAAAGRGRWQAGPSTLQGGRGAWGGNLAPLTSDRRLPVPAASGQGDAASLGGSLAPPLDVGESLWSEGAMDDTGDRSTLNSSGNSGVGAGRRMRGGGIDVEMAGRHRGGGGGEELPAMVGALASSRSLGASLVGRQVPDSGASDSPMARHRVAGAAPGRVARLGDGSRNRSLARELQPTRAGQRRIGELPQPQMHGSTGVADGRGLSIGGADDDDDDDEDSDVPAMRQLGAGPAAAVLDYDEDGDDTLSGGGALGGATAGQRRAIRRATLRAVKASERVGWGRGLLLQEEGEQAEADADEVADDEEEGSGSDSGRDGHAGVAGPALLQHPATSRRRLRMLTGNDDDGDW